MQNNKLLPCPFCGGEVEWGTVLKTWIVCKGCGFETPYSKDTENTVRLWNTRKPMERIVEQLENLCKYNSEQAEIYHNVEKPDAHTREMKDLYIERANCYGVAIRTVKGGVDNAEK